MSIACLAPAVACSQGAGDAMASCKNATDYETAIAACTRVIDSKTTAPHDLATAYSLRGGARNFGNEPGAFEDLDRAVRLAPDDAEIVANRAAAHVMRNQLDEAQRDVDAALHLDPRNLIALGNRAIIFEKLGQFPEARIAIDQALSVDPKDSRGWGERCWIGAVLADELPKSLSECDRAIELYPRDPNTFNSRGLVNFRMGRFKEALADYDHAIQGDPNVASSFLMRGLTRRALGENGSDDLLKSRQMEPGVAARYASYGIDTGASREQAPESQPPG